MRILIVTLFYPPLHSIASLRTGPMVNYLRQKGEVVDVLTRYYDRRDLASAHNMVSIKDTHEIKSAFWQEAGVLALPFSSTNTKLSIYYALPSPVNGLYNYLNADIFHDDFISASIKAFDDQLSENRYDLIIASFGPAAVIKVAKLISKKYGVPYIVDFRDAFITEKATGLVLFIMKKMQAHLMADSSGFIFASEGMRSYFAKHSPALFRNKPSEVVYNGASQICFQDELSFDASDQDVIESYKRIAAGYDLVLLHTGTIYAGQDINFFTDALRAVTTIRIAIVFVGLNDIEKTFQEYEGIFTLRKVSHQTSVYLQRQADALLLPVYANRYTGWSGKTFEYLASGNLVLCSPGPQQDLLSFFTECPNVLIMSGPAELCETVQRIHSGSIRRKDWVSAKLTKEYWLNKMHVFIKNLT